MCACCLRVPPPPGLATLHKHGCYLNGVYEDHIQVCRDNGGAVTAGRLCRLPFASVCGGTVTSERRGPAVTLPPEMVAGGQVDAAKADVYTLLSTLLLVALQHGTGVPVRVCVYVTFPPSHHVCVCASHCSV